MPPPALFCFVFKFLKNFFKLFCLYTSRGLSFPSYVTPRDIFPGHGDLGTDFLWGFLCKKSLWVSRNAVMCRRSEWERSGHVQTVISLQRWVNKVFWLLPWGIDCVGDVRLSHLLSSLYFFPLSLSLFFPFSFLTVSKEPSYPLFLFSLCM